MAIKLMLAAGDPKLINKIMSVFCLDDYSNMFDDLFKQVDNMHSEDLNNGEIA